MIRAIIIDDEARGRQTLQNLLEEYCPDVEVLALCDSAKAGIEAIEEKKPDLVFLDVEMPQMSGFDMLENIAHPDFEVIFTTAHSEHAIRAIKFSALDYLLKPIDAEELKMAVEKAISNIQNHEHEKLKHFIENRKTFDRIALPTSEGYTFLPIKDIIRCEASGSYTIFYIKGQESMLVCKNLKEYEEMLEEGHFYRVHHSHLINVDHITKYLRGDGGQVVMSDGSLIEVSRRKKEAFLTHLMHKEEKGN